MAAIGVLTLEMRSRTRILSRTSAMWSQGLKERLRHKFNVAVAEIDCQDLWQRGVVAAVTVSGDHGYAAQVLQLVEKEAAALLGPELVGATVEWLE